MRLDEFNLAEGVEDKGIFKAIFLCGLPGAGKTTVLNKITDGAVQPKIVNTDVPFEFLSKKAGIDADSAAWALYGKQSKRITENRLVHYLNGALPLFIDGTSANPGAITRRKGLLESLGYDTMLIWVNTDIEVAIKRVESRDRKVDPDFMERVYAKSESSKNFLKGSFGNYVEIDNNADDDFSQLENSAYKSANSFFNSDIANPIGSENLQKMKDNGIKYLSPEIVDVKTLKNMINVWYMK